MSLHACNNSIAGLPQLPSEHARIISPVNQQFWREGMATHPDKEYASYIVQGLERGFRIGFNSDNVSLRSARANHQSAALHPDVLSQYIDKELQNGRVAELPNPSSFPAIHISPLGLVPKKGKAGKWRMIMDLSSPEGHSVNDGITKESCSFHYTNISEAAARILFLGRGSLMAKMDIQQAYRNIPVAPEDRHLLGMGRVFVDRVLPFGLRLAPLLFSVIADALVEQ